MSRVNVGISVLLEPAGERDREGKQSQNGGGCCRETDRFLTFHLCNCSSDTNKLRQGLSIRNGHRSEESCHCKCNSWAQDCFLKAKPQPLRAARKKAYLLAPGNYEDRIYFSFANGHSSRVNIHIRLALETGFSSTKGSRTSSSHPAPWASLTHGPPRKAGSRPAPHLHSSIKAPNNLTFPPGGSR